MRPPHGIHSHKCRSCGFVWVHRRNDDLSERGVTLAHSCPKCGVETREVWQTLGQEPPKPAAYALAWGNKVPKPLTYKQGLDALNEAKAYAWAQVDKLGRGTMPPPGVFVPTLVARMKDMEVARGGFEVMVKKGAGNSVMPDKLRTAAVTRGAAVINEADRLFSAAMAEDKRIRDKLSTGSSIFKGVLIVAGIFGVAATAARIASASRNVRLTVRGYNPRDSLTRG